MVASIICRDSAGKQPLDMDFINREMTFISSERCTISCGTVCVDVCAARVLIIFNKRLGIWQLPKGRKNIGESLHAAALRETYEETGVRATLLPLTVRTRSTKPAPEENDSASASSLSPRSAGFLADPISPRGTGHAVGPDLPSPMPERLGSNGYPRGRPGAAIDVRDPDSDCKGENGSGGTDEGTCADTDTARDKQNDQSNNVSRRMAQANGSGQPRPISIVASAVAEAAADPKLTSNLPNNELIGIVQYPDLQAATPDTIKTVFFFAAFADSTAPMGPGAQEDHEDLCAEWVGFDEADHRLRFSSEREAMWKVKQDMRRSGVGS